MKLNRVTARALVDANLMSLSEYMELFGTPDEKDAGLADGLHVVRMRPASRPNRTREAGSNQSFPFSSAQPALARFHCH